MPTTEILAEPGEISRPTEAAPPKTPRGLAWLAANPREGIWILGGLAFLFRLLYVFRLSGTPYYHPDRLDPLFYFNWGRAIAAGAWIGDKIFVQSPLYAYVVAFFLKILGDRWIFPTLQIFQSLLGTLTCLLTVRIGRRVLGEREAWVGGLLAALYGPFLFYDGMVMKTFLSTFLTVAMVDLLLRSEGRRRGLLVLSGLVFAMTSLVRDNFVLLFPLLLAGLLLAFRETGRRERFRACLLFTLGAAAGILPVTLRNYAVGHELALLTTGGGEVFYIGNNPDANGRYLPPPFVHADPAREHDDFIAKASELSGRKLTPGESSAYWLRQGLDWIRSNPRAWTVLLIKKLVIFWNSYELPDNYNYYEVRRVLLSPLTVSGALLFAPLYLTFWIIAPLGLVGILLTGKSWRKLILVYLVLFGYMGTVLLFFNFSRFRVPIVPFLCLFAGATLTAFAEEARSWIAWFRTPAPAPPGGSADGGATIDSSDAGPPAEAGLSTAMGKAPASPFSGYLKRPWVLAYPLLFLVLLFTVNSIGTGGRGVFPMLQMKRSLGDTYRMQGRFQEAEREYRLGLQILGDEPMDPETARSLGVDPVRMRQEVESERMAQGVNFGTLQAGLHFGLGALLVDRGKDLLEKDRGKGEDLLRRGVKELETASKSVPYPPFLRRLAEGYSALGLNAEAEKAYKAALNIDPDDFGTHYDLAGLYYDTGRYPEALAEMQAARKIGKELSTYELSDYHYGVGLVYLDGYSARGKALYHLQEALRVNPVHREAKRIRELIEQIQSAGVKPEATD
jgi:dolichyl-phosphate-mannose-protein mannosyltransferase/tetratricopeptide repeat protein